MTSELQHLKQKIRRLEAGGEPNLAMRREYNAKLQAHRDGAAHLSGGGKGLKWFKEKMNAQLNPLKERVDVLEADIEILNQNDKDHVEKLTQLENALKEMVKMQREHESYGAYPFEQKLRIK